MADPLGKIDLWMVTFAVGPSLSGAWEIAAAELGPRLEFGWGHARGIPAGPGVEGSSGGTALLIAALAAAGRLRLTPRWWAMLETDGRPVLCGFTARVNTHDPSGLGGAMIGARLGIVAAM